MTDREQIRRDAERFAGHEREGLLSPIIVGEFAQAVLALLTELEQAEQNWPEGREGMAVVFDSVTRAYLGCIGIEAWNILVLEGDTE